MYIFNTYHCFGEENKERREVRRAGVCREEDRGDGDEAGFGGEGKGL